MIPAQPHSCAAQKRNPTITLFAALLTILAIVAAALLATNTQASNQIRNSKSEIRNPDVLAWRLVPTVTGANLRDVHMVSATDGWAVGENGTVLRYDGTSWSPVNINPQPSNETLVDVHMLSATDGYIGGWGESGASGTIYHWDGTNWTLVYNAPRDINRIDAVAPNDVWASGVGQIYHYNGTNWTLAYNVPKGPNVFAIQMVSANEGWAVGANQLIAHYLNGSWTILEPSPAPYTLYDSFFTAPNDGWAVGFTDSTYVMHYDGVEWTRAYSPTAQLSRMYFLSATDGWAISYSSILHYDGTGFTEVNNPYPDGLNSVYMLTPTEGWIVGTNGAMLHYSDDSTATPTVEATATDTVAATPIGTATATSTPACGAAWRVVNSPNSGIHSGLNAVAVVSANDIWAVGWKRIDSIYGASLVEHWDGTKWSVVDSPAINEYVWLYDIEVVSANDIWAVGTGASDRSYGFALHWDGTQWANVPAVNPGRFDYSFRSLTAISSNEVWAVGNYLHEFTLSTRTLVERWDGTSWSVVESPSPDPDYNTLTDISAINNNPNDIWATGYMGETFPVSLAMHWNGTQWNVVSTPNPGNVNYLYGVSGVSTDDVWAVGYSGGEFQSLIMRWDGTQWTVLPNTPVGTLYRVEAISANDVWAVGETSDHRTFAVHWDGTAWSQVPSPNKGISNNKLAGVAAVSDGDIWAVGSYLSGGFNSPPLTLVERYHDPCNTPTPIATSTATVPAATATATATAQAATATPTVCAVSFADVPSTNTFYAQIRCLVCRGIMGGYSDNTFRPNNDITRGQLSKIVANSGGFNEPVTGQTFEDVEPDNTFYVYVERMAGRGIIGGYNCGGAGEPCGTENKPYFRPNANATRGQISKIVSEAKGYGDPQTGQTFEDVAVGSTFHLWIERLASRGIMGGYACGGAGEPCGTGNKPYFRPNANATRGQTSKIVANTFFPGCQTASMQN